MCIGIPMQVSAVDADGRTWCLREGTPTLVDVSLVGPQPVGTWLLVFLDSAREVMDPEQAQLVSQALGGLAAAMAGEDFDHYFADLIDREPQLPPHLRPAEPEHSDTLTPDPTTAPDKPRP